MKYNTSVTYLWRKMMIKDTPHCISKVSRDCSGMIGMIKNLLVLSRDKVARFRLLRVYGLSYECCTINTSSVKNGKWGKQCRAGR